MKRTFLRPALKLSSLACAVVLLTACNEQEANTTSQQQPPPKVGFVTLEAQPYTLTTELPGRTAAYRIAEVRPQVTGIIQKRLFTEGTDIKAGDQLYQIDPAIYQANLKSAEANQIATRSLATRYKRLVDERAVSRQQYDDAHSAHLQAQAALEKAKIDLQYTQVKAPISGRIGRSSVTEGALVNNGQVQELAIIQQLDPIYVDVTQSSVELLRLREELRQGTLEKASDNAAKVTLQLENGAIYEHEGKLEFSEVSVEPSTGAVTLRAVFPNPEQILLPGMYVRAQLVTGEQKHAILAPQQGITRNPRGEPIAMVLNADNEVEVRTLKTERTAGNKWLVNEGLQAGDRLITEGLQFIQPGVKTDPHPASNVQSSEPASAATAN